MIITNELGQLLRRHGWIRTIVEGFADPDLTARPRDCIILSNKCSRKYYNLLLK